MRKQHGHRAPRARSRSHPVTLALGLLLVAPFATAGVLTVRFLYADYARHAEALDASAAVADAIRSASTIDESPPTPVDAVAVAPDADQVLLAQLPYAEDVPPDVARIRLGSGGALSVLMRSGALCSGVSFSISRAGQSPAGSFICEENVPPPAPPGLRATPHDGFVSLEWPPAAGAVEDYAVAYSLDGGGLWTGVDDGVTAASRATVGPLLNGREYLFRVSARNLAGQSPPVMADASPFTTPSPPTRVQATGGLTPVVSWAPAAQDGGRPVIGYVVNGNPTGRCTAVPPATSCELTDLPAAPGYTFTVRAVNDAGPGRSSAATGPPVSVFSAPGRAVAVTTAPGDGLVLLTWTRPLLDGNTPILDYAVDYKVATDDEWTALDHPQSTITARTVTGLRNGVAYDFRVLTINAAGASAPPLYRVTETPARVPDAPEALLEADADSAVTLAWAAPTFDGGAAITDYTVEYSAAGGPWTAAEHPAGATTGMRVSGLDNGTAYRFRVAAVNDMGTGARSMTVDGSPFTRPGPVRGPVAVGSLTSVALAWKPPADDGGRPIIGYRVDYRLDSAPEWTRADDALTRATTATVSDLVTDAAYDFRILAVTAGGTGPARPDSAIGPTLPGVIVNETPRAPEGLTVEPGDGRVTVAWQAVPAGPESPIEAYTVTGDPLGSCTTDELTCVVKGLANGTEYSFTVHAANSSLTGPESVPVTAIPQAPMNSAAGGTVTTYSQGGRTYRVHTFATSSALVVRAAARPFDILVVGGGGGSLVPADGVLAPGGGGRVLQVNGRLLPRGRLTVVVGAGGEPGLPGAPSSLTGLGTAAAGSAGSPTLVESWPARRSAITGRATMYGGPGDPLSGPGSDGRGAGGGGPTASRGGDGVVIVRYEIEP